jgi:hypothetical protein
VYVSIERKVDSSKHTSGQRRVAVSITITSILAITGVSLKLARNRIARRSKSRKIISQKLTPSIVYLATSAQLQRS